MLLLAFTGVANAQSSLHVKYMNGSQEIIDDLNMGLRPIGAWTEPFAFTMYTEGTTYMVDVLDFSPSDDIFLIGGEELPFQVTSSNPVNLTLTANGTTPGTIERLFLAITDSRAAHIWPLSAELYQPQTPDVWELAYSLEIGPSFSYMGVPSQITSATLHNDYTLPFPEIPEGYDAVYKLVLDHDQILGASVTGGNDGKVALYTEDFNGEDGPMATNAYNSNPVIQDLYLVAGTYYLVASSTTENFLVSINAVEVPSCTVEHLIYVLNDDLLTVTLYGHVDGTNASGELHIVDSVLLNNRYCHVVAIGKDAFLNCTGLSGSLTLPQTLVTIGSGAFYGCIGLTGSLTIPNSVTLIGHDAFHDCTGFNGIQSLGDGLTTIGDWAFHGCNGFTGSLTIPDAVTTIGEVAFENCSGFNGTLTLGSALDTISVGAFAACNNFTDIVSRATTPPVLGPVVFYEWDTIAIPVTVPCGNGEAYSSISWGGFSNFIEDCRNDNVVHAQYYPDANDPDSPYTVAYWDIELTDDFETGDFSKSPWQMDALYPWVICDTVSHSGTYCMRSGNIGQNSTASTMTVTMNIPKDGMISFYAKISCENPWDNGYFYIDDVQKGSWTGKESWTEYQYPVTAGSHTFRWKYEKDNDGGDGDDCLYVDDIVFFSIAPPTEPIDPSAAPSTDLFDVYRAKADGTDLTLLAEDYDSHYYLDSTWTNLAVGDYKYGVTYANDTLFVWSNSIEKPISIYEVTATARPGIGGTVSGAGTYHRDSIATLTATPAVGYDFVRWTLNGVEVSTDSVYSFIVTGDGHYVANFSPCLTFAIATHHPDPNDLYSPEVMVYWGNQIVEDFESGDFSQFDWKNNPDHPWTITTDNPYEGSYCMKSGGAGVGNMSSDMTVTLTIPADGILSFFGKISSEGYWDYGYFYIDGVQKGSYTGNSNWGEKKFDITQGTHTFKWQYTKDSNTDSYDDCFYVDDITFYKRPEPAQSGWHTYCESEFNNAVGSNVSDTPSWAYEYPAEFLHTNYAGWQITKVSLFSDNMYNAVGGNYTCRIYVGGNEPAAGTMVSTITVDVPSNQNAWVDWDLTTPVNVTGNETIWVVWTANTHTSSWPAGCCGNLNDLGTWWDGGNGWEHLTYGTWTMKHYFTDQRGRSVAVRAVPNHTFNVYRSNADSTNVTLIAENLTGNSYIDTTWQHLEYGSYIYGVSTVDNASIQWTNPIDHLERMYAPENLYVSRTGWATWEGQREYVVTEWTLTDMNDSIIAADTTQEFFVQLPTATLVDSTLYKLKVRNHYLTGTSPEAVCEWYYVSCEHLEGFSEITGIVSHEGVNLNWTYPDTTSIGEPMTLSLFIDGQWLGFVNGNSYYDAQGTINSQYEARVVYNGDTICPNNNVYMSMSCLEAVPMHNQTYDVTATANPAEGGTVSGAGTYDYGSTATLTATPSTGYHFLNWSQNGTVVTANDTLSFILTQDTAFVAHFEINNYEITATVDPLVGGSVTGAGDYDHFDTCTLVAAPAVGYHFVNWTQGGAEVSTSPTYQFEVTGAASFVAHFEINSYDVTASVNPSVGGPVTGAGTYDHGTNVTMTATPNTGYHFLNWSQNGTVITTDETFSFNITQDTAFVAHFEINNYEITATVDPLVGGSVTGAGDYDHFDTCTLVAAPAVGYHFVNWTQGGTEVGTSLTYQFEVTGAASFVANFEINSYDVTATANPTNGGTVTGAGTYDHGTNVTMTATPGTGYHFLNWSQNGTVVTTNETFSFTVTQDTAFVANFEINSYAVTASVNPSVGGTVSGTGTYDHGTLVTLTATPNTGYHFLNWSQNGNVITTDNTFSFNITQDTAFVAHFEINSYDVAASVNPTEGGTVTGTGSYDHGTLVTLIATPNTGYHFLNWSQGGVVVTTDNTLSFNVTQDTAFVAHFEINSYDVTATVNPTEGGAVTGTGTYDHGTLVTLTATPNTGYHFLNWSQGGTVVSTDNTLSFNVTQDTAFVAHFEINSYDVTAMVSPAEGGTVTGAGTYNHFETCTLTATASDTYLFVNWTRDGVEVSSEPSFTFTVTEAADYVANFVLNYIDIVAYAAQPYGTVTGGGTYLVGSTCTLTAVPDHGFRFLQWAKDHEVVSTDSVYSFVVTEAGTYRALFERVPYSVTVEVNPAEGGTVTGTGDIFYINTTCQLVATANDGYYFVNWMKDGEVVSTDRIYEFTVTGSEHFVANFAEVLGVEALEEIPIVIYPNPAVDKLVVKSPMAIRQCEVYSITGQCLLRMKDCGEMFEIQLNDFVAGSYVVRLISDTSVQTKEFVKY